MGGPGPVGGKPIRVLTGEIRTGKTTRLREWVSTTRRAGTPVLGILAPVIQGERHLCFLNKSETDPCTSLLAGPDDDVVTIGPHRFAGSVFASAREHLLTIGATARLEGPREGAVVHAATPEGGVARAGPPTSGNMPWVVLDEIGPLELRGEGLEPAVRPLVEAALASGGNLMRVVLVVRERLLEQVIGAYRLEGSWEPLELP